MKKRDTCDNVSCRMLTVGHDEEREPQASKASLWLAQSKSLIVRPHYSSRECPSMV